jgi:hypothetical protein
MSQGAICAQTRLPNASVTLTGLPVSPYRYELVFPSYGDIPANVTYWPRNSDLATVKTTYRAPVNGVGYASMYATDGKYDLEGALESRPEPEAHRKGLSWRVIRHGRRISNFEEGPPPCSCREVSPRPVASRVASAAARLVTGSRRRPVPGRVTTTRP